MLRASSKVYFSQELITTLNLRAGQPINLLPPSTPTSPYWHLDLRPTAPHSIDWYPGKRTKIKRVELPPSLLLPEQGLALELVPGPPAHAGFYPLMPAPIPPQGG